MSAAPVGLLRRLWFQWKSLKLPWRRQHLAGMDLAGNTFWEFKDTINSSRYRRIVKYNTNAHYADVKLTPQWHQWLRQARPDAPSFLEQQTDITRQAQLKQLAQVADERWASKPSFLAQPTTTPVGREQPAPATLPRDPGGYVGKTESEEKEGVRSAVGGEVNGIMDVEGKAEEGRVGKRGKGKRKEDEKNPWDVNRKGPSEGWQPQAWTPGPARR
ncbi:MAG: hypothetical protein M1827_003711 [Pycnora praestabilis]|nr:MAG: hypothetical protein M1827_003711 [Pycnora praestabilis]